jgi:hypothetical protein
MFVSPVNQEFDHNLATVAALKTPDTGGMTHLGLNRCSCIDDRTISVLISNQRDLESAHPIRIRS